MTDFIQEAAKEVKIERIQEFAKKYTPHLAVFIVLMALAFLIYHWYSKMRENAIHQEGSTLLMSVYKENGLRNSSEELENLVDEGSSVYATVAQFARANDFLSINNKDEAKVLLEQIAASEYKEYADLATLTLLTHYDIELTEQEVQDNMYSNSILEMQGVKQMQKGNNEKAIEFFDKIVYSTNAPLFLRERVRELKNLALYNISSAK